MGSTSTRKPCFLEDDNGLASIADYTFSSSSSENHQHQRNRHRLVSRAICSPRKTSPKTYAASPIVSSPRSGRFLNGRFEEQRPYFLHACFLCKKPLACNTDIFMYRGDTAFCSDECRTEQIDRDEAKDNWTVSVSLKSMRKKEQKEQSSSNTSSPNKTSKNYPFQSGAVAAA